MLNYLRDNDEVIVVSLDHLGRNSKDLTDIIEAVRQQSATLNVLNLPSLVGIEDSNLHNLITNIIVELYKYYPPRKNVKQFVNVNAKGLRLLRSKASIKEKSVNMVQILLTDKNVIFTKKLVSYWIKKKLAMLISRRDRLPECWVLHL
jgi:hypothetical protein